MSTISFLVGLISILGYFVFFIEGGQPGTVFWVSVFAALAATIIGIQARANPKSRLGRNVGILGLVIGAAIYLWLSL